MVRYVPTLGLMALVLLAALPNITPSRHPEILVFSYLKFGMLCFCGAVLAYLAWSLKRPGFLFLNKVLFTAALACLILSEIVLRFFPHRLPREWWMVMPAAARKRAAEHTGLFVEEKLQGRGMLYAYRPGLKDPALPWLAVDANGYRNPRVPTETVDVVLLGDSLLIATGAKRDLGARFRQDGMTAVNLGFGGYSPQHYLEAYRTYVATAGIPHRWVVVSLCLENDFIDAERYRRIREENGDWRDYLGYDDGSGEEPAPFWQPMAFQAVGRLAYLRHRFRGGEKLVARLDSGRYALPADLFRPNFSGSGIQWQEATTALKGIADLAREREARLVLALMPTNGLLFGPFVEGHEQLIATLEREYLDLVARLGVAFSGVIVLDLTPTLREATAKNAVILDPLDNHFNDLGISRIYRELHRCMDALASTGPSAESE